MSGFDFGTLTSGGEGEDDHGTTTGGNGFDMGTITDIAGIVDQANDLFNPNDPADQFNGDGALFWAQLSRNSYADQAYFAWCREFFPAAIITGSVWDGPFSVYKFRAGVPDSAHGGPGTADAWKNYIGRIAQDFSIKQDGADDPTTGGHRGLSGGTVMVWPWESGALKAADGKTWAVWLLIVGAIGGLAWLVFGGTKRRKQRRKAL